MKDEQENQQEPEIQEPGVLAEKGSLFAEAARRVEKKAQRKTAAKEVKEWLEAKTGDGRAVEGFQVTRGEMARKILEGLGQGRIFFGVKEPEQLKQILSIGAITAKIPWNGFYEGGIATQQTTEGVWIVLLVKQGIKCDELLKEIGDEAIEKLYKLDLATTLGRMAATDPFKLKDSDIGSFPVEK